MIVTFDIWYSCIEITYAGVEKTTFRSSTSYNANKTASDITKCACNIK